MNEPIYAITRHDGVVSKLESRTFSELKIAERADLEAWIHRLPDILGERLLSLSTEFSAFVQSSRRIDLLMLDASFNLVIVELKLEADGSHAELQAIRYAAMCSTMTVRQAIDAYCRQHGVSPEIAEERMLEFLDRESLPDELGGPRIILAAGSMDNKELTSTVLWLRRKGLDITCVELTPYVKGASNEIIIIPKIIIPIPETREFQIAIETRERSMDDQRRRAANYESLWRVISESLDKSLPMAGIELKPSGRYRTFYWQIDTTIPNVHYEFWQRARKIDVVLHFENPENAGAINREWLKQVVPDEKALEKRFQDQFGGVGDFLYEPTWGRHGFAAVGFRTSTDGMTDQQIAEKAIPRMLALIEATKSRIPMLRGPAV
jgi:hypothetical protein